jgi:toluene monooxygenase electron transfer component
VKQEVATASSVATHTVSVEPAGVEFEARADEPILAAGRRAGVWLPFECGWGTCATCKVQLLEGNVRSLFDEAPAIRPQDERRSRILACQSVAESDLVIKVKRALEPREDLPTVDVEGTLTAAEEIGPDIRLFRFDVGTSVDFRPGQYAILEPTPGLRRAYSMTSLPGESTVEFLIKRYDGKPGTNRLFELEPGTAVPIELPFGSAYHRPGTDQMPVFVAGGTGLGPILGMLRALDADGSREADGSCVLYGAPSVEELVLVDELEPLCERLGARFVPVVERPGEDWEGEIGYVTAAMADAMPAAWEDLRYYVAGPPVMVDATLDLLNERSVQIDRIHHDAFG